MELLIIVFAIIITLAIHYRAAESNIRINLTSITSLLMFFALFLEIIPVYRIPYLQIAPDNLIYGFVLVIFLSNFKTYSKRMNKYIGWIIVSYVLYQLLKVIMGKYSGMEAGNQYFIIRDISILLIFQMAIDKVNYSKFLKIFTILLFVSMFLGILIYIFGEPFASLRMEILNDPFMRYYGKGDRIAGFYKKIFTFGYLLAALPVLIFTFYKKERKFYWLIMLFISIFGLLLNAERATMILSSTVIIFLSFKWFKGSKKIPIFISIIIVLIAIQQFYLKGTTVEHGFYRIDSTSSDEIHWKLAKQYAAFLSILKNPLTGGDRGVYKNIYYSWAGYSPNAPHNAYVNIGMYGGVLGWLLFLIFAYNIVKIIKIFRSETKKNYSFRILYQGISGAFLGVLGVGLFHNAGIFDGETTSFILLMFLIAGSTLNLDFDQPNKMHTLK